MKNTLLFRKSNALLFWSLVFLFLLNTQTSCGQTNNYFGTAGTITGSVWSTNPAGPYTSALVTTGGPILNFNNAGAATGGTIATCVGMNFGAAITWSAVGTFGAAGINLPISVASGVSINFTSGFSTSATSAVTKNGVGEFATVGGTYAGGFTLNSGTLAAASINAMGNGSLTINGGTISGTATRTFAGKFTGITVGGNFTLGATTGLSLGTSNLTFDAAMALGASTRTITIGGTGVYTLGGIISGSTGSGLTIASTAAGSISLRGVNTYTGDTTISSGTLALTTGGSIASSPVITLGSGGTFNVSGLTTALTLAASQSIRSSATGSNTTATITVASSKGITFNGTTPGSLVFTAYGGGNTAPLTVTGASAGTLDLASAPVTVTTTTPLGVGTYVLVEKAGSVTAAVSGTLGTLTVNGSGLAESTSGALSISAAGRLVLTVTSTVPPAVLTSVTLGSALTTTYGTAATGVSFTAAGTDLTTTITVTPQTNYEIATDQNGSYQNTAMTGVTNDTTLWVRIAATAPVSGSYNNVTCVVLSDGGAASNANITTFATGNAVTSLGLTITGVSAINKTFDGNTAAVLTGTAALNGVLFSDDVVLGGTPSATFSSAAVGTWPVTVTGYSISGTKAANYTLSQPTVANATIDPSSLTDQVLTFPALSNVPYGTVSVSLLATSDNPGGNPITYSSSNTNVATISGSSAVIVGAGTTTITASQAGSGTHNAAVSVTQELTVNKATPTISVAPTASAITYGQTLASSSLTGGTASVAGTFTFTTPSTAPNGGIANQGVTFTPTDTVNYNTITSVASVTVNKANQSISNFTATDSRELGAATYALGATATNGGSVTYTNTNNTTVASVSGNTVTIIGLGTSIITATQAGDSNYNPISANQTLTVTYPVLAGWDFTGVGSVTNTTVTATTFNSGLVSTDGANTISRGGAAAWSTGANSFRTLGFKNEGIATTNTDYFQTTLIATTGNVLNLATISANLAGTASFTVSPGVSSQFAYSLDGTSFTLIGSPIVTIGTPASLSVDLTGIAALQNIEAGTTVTFRYYASGQTTTGGWGFNSVSAGTNGLAFSGLISKTPPTVTTNAATLITTTSATLNGTVNANDNATTASFDYGTTHTATTPSSGAVSGTSDTATSLAISGLSVNTQYTYKAIASGGLGGTVNGSDVSFYTLANAPSAPTLSNALETSIDVAITSGDGNPSTTLYALQLNNNTYVQVGGASLGAAVWQTAAEWGTTTVSNLDCGAAQAIKVYAKNGDGVLTTGTSASLSTTACTNPSLQADPLAAFNAICITTSLTKDFALLGINLTSNVTINSLAGFTFSTDNSNFTTSLTLTPINGELLETISVKFTPTVAQSYSGSISITGGGTSGITVAVTASGINTPVSSVVAGAISGTTAISVVFEATTFTQGCSNVSASGIQYSTDTSFSSSAATNGSSATINGLAPNTLYNYRAYASDNTGTVTGSASTFTTSGIGTPTATAATDVTASSFTANWGSVAGATDYRLDVSTLSTFGITTNNTNVQLINNNGTIGALGWTEINVNQSSGYLNMVNNTSTLITSSMDLTNFSNISLNFRARTFGGTNTAANTISVSISTNNGSSWTPLSTRIPTTTTLTSMVAFDLGAYTVSQVKIRFQTLGATGSTGIGIDDIIVAGNETIFTPSFLSGYNNLDVGNVTSKNVDTNITPTTTYYYRVRANSTNSTSANSNTITVTTTAAPPTFTAIAQAAAVCEGSGGTFNVTGLLASVPVQLTYAIGTVVVDQTVAFTPNGSGFGTFNLTLPLSYNGQTLTVSQIKRTDTNQITAVSSGNTALITVNAKVTPTFSALAPICAGGSSPLPLTSSNGVSGTWSPSFNNTTSGTYTFIPTVGACATDTTQLTVTVNQLPTATISAGGPITFCAGGTVTLTATAASSYLWSTGATTQSIVVGTSGTYKVKVTDGNGCTSVDSAGTIVTVGSALAVGTVSPITTVIPGADHVVISQVYGGGGNTGATYRNDFVELYNSGDTSVSLNGWSVQQAAAVGTAWNEVNLTGSIPAKGYYLVQGGSSGATGELLPTANATGTFNFGVGGGKIALSNSTTSYDENACPSIALVDFIGFGASANCSETSAGPIHTNTTATIRNNNGCVDTDDNSADFTVGVPTPRNTSSSIFSCTTSTSSETICSGDIPTAMSVSTASGSTSPYTYQWYSYNGLTTPTATPNTGDWTALSIGLSLTPAAITQNTTYACFITPTGCAGAWATNYRQVTANELPTATIDGTTAVCKNATAPTVTFTGSNGTAPYTFTYTLNNGSNQTIVSTANTASIVAPTGTVGTFTYALVSVQDASSTACANTQTGAAVITVNPLPTASIAGTTAVCKNATAPTVTFTGSNGTAPYTFTYSLNNGSNQTIVSTGNTASIVAPTGTVGTFTYALVSVQDASSTACANTQTGAAVITVNPLPTATIAGTTAVCQNGTAPTVTFTGSNGTAPYTFTYTLNNGSNQTIVSTANTASITAPTGVAGTFTYALVSVQDASATTCLNSQTGAAVITVNPLPTASIAGTTAVCQNGTAPTVTFTGSNGTAPYTFNYNAPGGPNQTVVSNSLGFATITAPTDTVGMLTYTLLSVQDSSATTCSNVQSGAVTITVNPLPTATIAGSSAVCQNDTTPLVTFTGANGTSPYTFTYKLSGVADNQTVTTALGEDSVTVAAPTGVAGTFVYSLVSVQDASAATCLTAQLGDVTIIIHPTPTVTSSLPNQSYYSGYATTAVPLTGTPSGVTFDITGGALAGLPDQYGVTAIPGYITTAVPATITITPKANGCTGASVSYQVTGVPVIANITSSVCGSINNGLNNQIQAGSVSVPGYITTGYRFEVTNTASGEVRYVNTVQSMFKLTDTDIYSYGTTFTIRVAVILNGNVQGFYGNTCSLTTASVGTTRVIASQCGSTLATITSTINANTVASTIKYRFRIALASAPMVTYLIERTAPNFKLTDLISVGLPILYNTEYLVDAQVRVKLANIEAWSQFGVRCSVWTPLAPETSLVTSQCEMQATSNTQVITANAVVGASVYRFLLTQYDLDGNVIFSQYYDSPTPSFTLSNFTGLQPDTTYSVAVAMQFYGSFVPYGKDCSITTTGFLREGPKKEGNVAFKATAYPNPFANNFSIAVEGSQQDVLIKVYDMLGRVIDQKTAKASDVTASPIGEGYPSGVYSVVVTQGDEVKTLRVVKR